MRQDLVAAFRREFLRRYKTACARAWILCHPQASRRVRDERAWLIGGSSGRVYADNSAALHRHLRRNRPELAVYWVIDRKSPDVPLVQAQGPVLFSDDIMTFVRAMLARVHVVSHGVHDVPASVSRWAKGALKVRLGHGLTALKRTKPRRGHTNASANAIFDLVPVCSEFERANKREWGFAPEKLVVAGMPRFDTLLDRQAAQPADARKVLYMPTWRDELSSAADWPQTAFFAGVREFLAAPSLQTVLERHEVELLVCLHANMQPHLPGLRDELECGRVQFVFPSDPQSLLAEAGLLITDYSSVAWDFLYLDKPVAFYQFDAEAHARHRGSYVEAGADFPGPIARTAAETIGLLGDYLSGEWVARADWRSASRRWQAKAFAFRDRRNCERVVAEIHARLAERDRRAAREAR